MGNQRELLKMELRNLRKGRGVTLLKVMASPILTKLLSEDGRMPDVVFRERVSQLDGSVKTRALWNAYGFDYHDPRTLTIRRADFSVQNDKHADTIEDYENQMIDELAVRLLAGAGQDMDTETIDPEYYRTLFHDTMNGVLSLIQRMKDKSDGMDAAYRGDEEAAHRAARAAFHEALAAYDAGTIKMDGLTEAGNKMQAAYTAVQSRFGEMIGYGKGLLELADLIEELRTMWEPGDT